VNYLLSREIAVGFYEKPGYIKEGECFIEATILNFLLKNILEQRECSSVWGGQCLI